MGSGSAAQASTRTESPGTAQSAQADFALPRARFDFGQIGRVFRNRGVRLANFGYFGHMWELYAMWTWIPVMIRASFAARGSPHGLAEAGALDVFYASVQMKKNRPGTLLTILARPEHRQLLMDIVFRETTTIGVRYHEVTRERLDREIVAIQTTLGPIRFKIARLGGDIVNAAPEFDDAFFRPEVREALTAEKSAVVDWPRRVIWSRLKLSVVMRHAVLTPLTFLRRSTLHLHRDS